MFFLLHHFVLMRFSSAYKRLNEADRLVACQHAVYAVVFTLSVVPQTVLAVKALFHAFTGSYLASAELSVLVGVFIPTRAVLYVGEAAGRSTVKFLWLLVVHHLLLFAIVVLAFWSLDTAVVGIGIVLDLFACHEFPLYIALLAHRLCWPPGLARGILRGACGWYILTRLVQTVFLVFMIVKFAAIPAINKSYEFIVTAVLCGALTVIQAYTLVIYRAIDAKLSKKVAAARRQGCCYLPTSSTSTTLATASSGGGGISSQGSSSSVGGDDLSVAISAAADVRKDVQVRGAAEPAGARNA